MKRKTLHTNLDTAVKDKLDAICNSRGVKRDHFVQEAILDKIEELEDLEDIADLKKLRREEFISLSELTKGLTKLD